ncbi:MAG TPA: hypothetical protein VN946_04175 [Terriglobales bacterium]|jgi:hypothetical protein|nr:hypothetical protein [Terriglobales bacterium]
MRFIVPRLRFVVLCVLLIPSAVWAQDDAPSLGDLARNLRNDKDKDKAQQPQPLTVIDNDNLTQVMEDAKSARPVDNFKTVLSIDPSGNTLKVSSPDVTCSLSFNARSSSLIKSAPIEELPLTELLKIDGPGSIQDESLQLQVFNGTDWDIKEITVGLTLERKPGENAERAASARVIPAAEGLTPVAVERRSDVTLLYHLKAESKPFSTTEFHENIGISPGPDEDWRWSIVSAKGIRPAQSAPDSLTDPLGDPLFAAPLPLTSGSHAPQLAPIAPVNPGPPEEKPGLDKSPGPGATPQ